MRWFKKKNQSFEDFEFKCSHCDKTHKGIPSLVSDAPDYFYSIPEKEREERVQLNSDTCIVDDEHFFVRGCLEIPVHGFDEPFSFGAWISLSQANFIKFEELFNISERDQNEPMFGWFSTWIYPYYETKENIKSRIHLRNNGIRPFIELEPSGHPLSLAQQNGITKEDIVKIYEHYIHW